MKEILVNISKIFQKKGFLAKKGLTLVIYLIIGGQIFINDALAANKHIMIASGNINGVFHTAGSAICRMLNRGRKEHGIRCSVSSTQGSVYNLNALRHLPEVTFGIAQSDWQFQAYKGIGPFANQKPFEELRYVFSLYTETFILAVADNSFIRTIDDIVGKRVNYGPRTSGTNATMQVLVNIKGWTDKNFDNITYLQAVEEADALCNGKIDVMIYASGNPNEALREASQNCKIRLLQIDQETINKMTQSNPFYVKAVIPGGTYANNPNNIETFGIKVSLLTSERISVETVYQLTKSVFDNLDNFKTLNPVFSSLKKEDMIKEGNFVPIHPGALKYYQEAGLLK
jgi:TRAP transporter TAXI family solute receptor